MIEYNYYADVYLVGSRANILVEKKKKKRLKELASCIGFFKFNIWKKIAEKENTGRVSPIGCQCLSAVSNASIMSISNVPLEFYLADVLHFVYMWLLIMFFFSVSSSRHALHKNLLLETVKY